MISALVQKIIRIHPNLENLHQFQCEKLHCKLTRSTERIQCIDSNRPSDPLRSLSISNGIQCSCPGFCGPFPKHDGTIFQQPNTTASKRNSFKEERHKRDTASYRNSFQTTSARVQTTRLQRGTASSEMALK